MLPFLKPRATAGVIISKRKPDGAGIESGPMESEGDQGLEACAEALLRAIQAKDAKALAQALQDAFECFQAPGEDDNSFDAQNAKAAASQQE